MIKSLSLLLLYWVLAQSTVISTDKQELYPAELLQISDTPAFAKHVFVVDKSQRQLMVFERKNEGIQLLTTFPADIGKNDGKKEKSGDQRTPEGIYFFQKKLTNPEIPFELYGKMAFTLDYPNLFDRRLRKTGSGIWLHSVPDTVPLTRGSKGCVVVRNDVIVELEKYIELEQTPILIFDKITYLPKSEHEKKRAELTNFIESWRLAWESKNLDNYLSFYANDFSAPPDFNLKKWRSHKIKIAKRRDKIKVTFSQPFLLVHRDSMIIKTLQKYQSDEHTDFGVKLIYAAMTDKGFKIIREEWSESTEAGQLTETPKDAPPPGPKKTSEDNKSSTSNLGAQLMNSSEVGQ